MRYLIILALVTLVGLVPAAAQEVLTLTTPEDKSAPDRVTWKVVELSFVLDKGADDFNHIRVVLEDNNGVGLLCQYYGATARADMVTLNKVNLSTNSLQKRVVQRLQVVGGTDDTEADGGPCLPAGSVTGTPE